MNSKEFNNLSKRQLRYGFFACLENTEAHFATAEWCAKKNYFGIANSHLILASEEAIKAIVFCFKYECPAEQVDIGKIFFSHKDKHEIAMVIFREVHRVSKQHFLQLIKLLGEFCEMKPDSIEKKVNKINSRHLKINKLKVKKWWKEANDKKNLGFYVGKKNNKWQNPKYQITKSDFNRSQSIVSQLTDFIEIKKSSFK